MRWLRCWLVLAVLVGTLGVQDEAAAVQPDFVVQAGARHPDASGRPFEFTRYYPEALRVHRGQVVLWKLVGEPLIFAGFHTITFAPGGEAARPALFRPDELPGTFSLNEAWYHGSRCGHSGQAVCELNQETVGTVLTSGAPLNGVGGAPWQVRVGDDLPLGAYTYFCTVHERMTGTLEVVADDVELADPADIAIEVAAQIRADAEAADEILTAPVTPEFRIDEQGRRVWEVQVGAQTPDSHVQIAAYFPAGLQLEPGDGVHWALPDEISDAHTVTFPSATLVPFPFLFLAGEHTRCDLDGPSTGAPGIPGAWLFLPASCPGTVETAATTAIDQIRAPDDEVLTAATAHHSAWMWSAQGPEALRGVPPDSGRRLASTFDAFFPVPGAFSFACAIHLNGMTGSVDVM